MTPPFRMTRDRDCERRGGLKIIAPPAPGPYLYWHWALADAGLRIITEFY